jgi:DNA-binding transcriptional regulator LsrR (DeoR family)
MDKTMMAVVPLHGRMSDAEYDVERERLRETYGDTAKEANARREQELARLFYRSGWTQEELARKEDQSQRYISYLLVFGRFLNFSTMVLNPNLAPNNLSERRFRKYWEQTPKGDERVRFAKVLELMKVDIGLISNRRPPIGQQIKDQFADGKWHRLSTIAEHVETSEEHVVTTIKGMFGNQNYDCTVEKKQVGTHFEYRIFKMDKTIGVAELLEKLEPIVKGLEEQGRRHNATMSVVAVARLAMQLRSLLDEWAE